MKLSYCAWSNRVCFVKETKQDNDITGHIRVVYIETKTELSGHI